MTVVTRVSRETRFERRLHRRNRPVMHLFFEATRRLGPVVRVPGIGRVVNDPHIARAVLRAPEAFNSHDHGSFGALIAQLLGPDALINMDGPAHQRLKRELMQVFSNRYVSQVLERATGPLLEAFTARLRAGEAADFAVFMRRYGCAIACAMVGVRVLPGEEARAADDIFELATEIMALAASGRRSLDARGLAAGRGYARRLFAYVEASYGAPGEDDSVTQRLRAMGFGVDAVKGLVAVVLVGATELVIYGLPRALAVMVDSGAWPRVRAEPARLDDAIDEALRLTTPSNVVLRATGADHAIGRHRFRRGERVLVAFRNALRDPAHFAQPERFDLDRVVAPEFRRLPFGAGTHACLGGAMTLAEMRHVLGALAALPGGVEIGERRYNRGKLYPGYTRLMVRIAAA